MKKFIFILLALLYSTSSFASETNTEAVPNTTECINKNSLMLAMLSVMHDYSLELATLYSLTTINRNLAFANLILLNFGYKLDNTFKRGLITGCIDGIITQIEIVCIATLIKFFSGKVLDHFEVTKVKNDTQSTQKIKFEIAIFILRSLHIMQLHMRNEAFMLSI